MWIYARAAHKAIEEGRDPGDGVTIMNYIKGTTYKSKWGNGDKDRERWGRDRERVSKQKRARERERERVRERENEGGEGEVEYERGKEGEREVCGEIYREINRPTTHNKRILIDHKKEKERRLMKWGLIYKAIFNYIGQSAITHAWITFSKSYHLIKFPLFLVSLNVQTFKNSSHFANSLNLTPIEFQTFFYLLSLPLTRLCNWVFSIHIISLKTSIFESMKPAAPFLCLLAERPIVKALF